MTAPEPLYPFKSITPIQIRFNDIDILGHVNNSMYAQYMDQGKIHYFEQVFGRYFNPGEVGVVIARTEYDFYKPAFMHEPVAVLSQVQYITEKTMLFEQRLINTDTQEVITIAKSVMVGYDPQTLKSAPINPDQVKAYEDFEGRPLLREPHHKEEEK